MASIFYIAYFLIWLGHEAIDFLSLRIFFATLLRSKKCRQQEVTEIVLSIDLQKELSRSEKYTSQSTDVT